MYFWPASLSLPGGTTHLYSDNWPAMHTGLSGSVLGKLPSRLQDEKHIFWKNYVGFSCIARAVLNRTWKYFQVEIGTIFSLKIKDARGRPRVEWFFTLVGHIFRAYSPNHVTLMDSSKEVKWWKLDESYRSKERLWVTLSPLVKSRVFIFFMNYYQYI